MQQNFRLVIDTGRHRIVLLVITWFQVVPSMFNPGKGGVCRAQGSKTFVWQLILVLRIILYWSHFNLVSVVPLMFNPGKGAVSAGPNAAKRSSGGD